MVLCGILSIETHAQISHWQFDPYAYRYDMTTFVSLSIDGDIVTEYSDYEIAAFCGDECRGIATIQKVERDGTEIEYGYLRIRSNKNSGETISFKVFQKSTEQEMNIYNTFVEFHSQQVIGMPSSPMLLPVVHFSVSVSCDEKLGIVSGDGVYEAGTTASLTATPKEGYHFVNWSDGADSNPYEFTVIENVQISASFAPNQYTMTFVLDNGEDNVEKTQDYASDLTAPVNPTRTGFTFKGWDPEVPATVPASDQTFVAKWERNSYRLTWDVDGNQTEVDVQYEASITKPEDPSKEGYTFIGWTPDVSETMPAEDVTYVATWEINQYPITYDLAGGTLPDGVTNPTSYTIESDDIILSNPTRDGYTFEGWIGSDLLEPTLEVTIAHGCTGERSYTAMWSAINAIIQLSNDSKSVNVYDLNGRIVNKNIPISLLKKELPCGIYIIDGKKIIINK